MTSFNKRTSIGKSSKNRSDATTNFEGGLAYSLSPKLELYQRLSTWLVNEPKFYGNTNDETDRIKELIQNVSKTDPEFVLKLAVYARNDLYLRTAPTFLLVQASLIPECKPFIKKYTPHIIKRADQITESLAMLKSFVGDLGDAKPKGSIPAGLKKGLAESFTKFGEYNLAKYNKDAEFKLKDALKLLHPKPKDDKQSTVFKQILDGTLASPDTWEVVISTKGSTKENWESVIPKMKYMGLMRNLRNFLSKGIEPSKFLPQLTNKEAVLKSKQLVFRYLSAYKAVQDSPNEFTVQVLDGIAEAMEYSIDNLPKLTGVTSIWADHSGSMESRVSMNSDASRKEIADCMLAIAHKISDNPVTGIFGTNLRAINITKKGTLLSVINELRPIDVGGATHTQLIMDYLLEKKIKVDRIIVCTDEQGYGGSFYEKLMKYRSEVNPNTYCYMINLAGYGTSEVPENDTKSMMIGGFSDRIFELITMFESDRSKTLKHIESTSV